MQKKLQILLLFLLTAFAAKTQHAKKFHINNYTTENGLPSNGIKGLQWDEQNGFLWIATEAGVSRFNGLDFKNFTVENTPFIRSERMLFIIKNNKGQIYTADQGGNIIRIKKNKLEIFKPSADVKPQSFNKRFSLIISDTFFLNQSEYKGSRPVNLLFDNILPLSDTFAFIIHAGRLYTFKMGQQDVLPYDNTNRTGNGFVLNKKCYSVFGGDSIFLLNEKPELNRYIPVTDENGSSSSAILKDGVLIWTNGMDQPIFINKNKAWGLSENEEGITARLLCDEIPTDTRIEFAQYSAAKQLLFIGTDSKGLIVISSNRVTAMKSQRSSFKERNAYYSQVELENGNVLTNEGHIVGFNKSGNSKLPIKGKFSFMVSNTSRTETWYTQFQPSVGMPCPAVYNPVTGKTKIYSKIRTAELIVKKLSDGRIFMATEFGFGWLADDSLQYIHRHPVASYNNIIYCVEEISPEKIVLGTCSGLLSLHPSTGKIDTVVNSPGICIRSSLRYKEYIFFGTYGKGYYVLKNGVLKTMPLDKRKYLLYTHCFVPDENGYCWISTNRGLLKANLSEIVNAYEKNQPAIYYHYFGKNDGMEMMEMNGGCSPCALTLKNKTISFPTMDGLLWVNPEKAIPVLPDGEIFIDEISADSISINAETDKIVLPAKTNELIFKLSFAAWCNKENIYLEYQLDDTANWKPVATEIDAIIRLTNLSPGQHLLRIRKLNGYGITNYSYKQIAFAIIVPWYKKLWFNFLVLLFIGGLISLYIRFRTGQLKRNQDRLEKLVTEKTKELQEKNEVLEKNDSIKTRLISIISHDIVTPLKFLTAAGKNLIDKKQQMPAPLQEETLKEMTNTSQELQMLSTNILNWIKFQNENRRMIKEHFKLYELTEQVIGILKSLAKNKDLFLLNEVSKDIILYQYFEPVKILLYNLLTNAINFSEQGTVRISGEKKDDVIKLVVEDEGVGMTPEQVQHLLADEIVITAANIDNKKGHGLGFLIIKDLLKMTGGSMTIKSEKAKGSKIGIVFPAANQKNSSENS